MKFVIGDIHGEITKLRQLISNIEHFQIEKLIFIGDYVNKGENSFETLNYLNFLSKNYNCIFLLGNHEYAWIKFGNDSQYKDYLLQYGGLTTLHDFNIKKFEPDNVISKLFLPFKSFFDKLIPYICLEDYIIFHSGLNLKFIKYENWEKIKRKEFLFQRYEFLGYHESIQNKIFIIGHTGFYFPYFDGVKISVDTGAAYLKNAPLTAFELNNKFFINHFNNKIYLNDLDMNICPAIIRSKPYRNR